MNDVHTYGCVRPSDLPSAGDNTRLMQRVSACSINPIQTSLIFSVQITILLHELRSKSKQTIYFRFPGPPSAPNGPLTALEVREESIVLQWAAPDDDGGSHITGYRLETRKVRIDEALGR